MTAFLDARDSHFLANWIAMFFIAILFLLISGYLSRTDETVVKTIYGAVQGEISDNVRKFLVDSFRYFLL